MAIVWGVIILGAKPIMENELVPEVELLPENESLKDARMTAGNGSVTEPEQITMLYKGDSITYGIKLPSNMTFAYFVNETLNKRAVDNQSSYRFEYVNTAVSGQTSREAPEEFFEEFNETKPDIVFLMYGTNDVDYYWGDQRHSVYLNLDKMASYALDNGAESVIIGLPPATRSERENNKILPLGLYLKENFKDKEGVYVFDMATVVDLSPSDNVWDGYNNTYYLDGVHLNELGNKAVAQELAPLVGNLTEPIKYPVYSQSPNASANLSGSPEKKEFKNGSLEVL